MTGRVQECGIDDSNNFIPKHAVWVYGGGKISLSFEESNEEDHTKEIFNSALDSNFPGAKRIKNTGIYEVKGSKVLIKYSRSYREGVHYWFGISENEIERLLGGETSAYYLFCIGNGFVVIDKAFLKSIKDKLNVTERDIGNLYHFHIDIFKKDKIQIVLRNGDRVNIESKTKYIDYKTK